MSHLICYDITKNGLRTKLSQLILATGLDRINKSVYLGTISDSSLKSMEQQLAGLLQSKGGPSDSLIIIPLTTHQVEEMRVYGKNDLDKGELTGTTTTIIV